ncbi:energy-coupling factor transporter transmembrane component T family protein [Cellulomonas shaoxiangyii]|uniref:Energy-coupling factor transporter transmembrane protein EcfT n=1 Tax=Cellulomonas shaoxiangyii TaxID=2566013 RepID=A0A4P7SHV7_9CELL|nr:energy-coupling factor transporter transmembrane protein EcfT [Cellulomonas shaoxiangyii]QCB93819.1 energy-coupling factor transporter transmembrane protein EcfT [Cellulomonas shaoxiangyii]TGY84487.1 energy-coupling factor transporter transmembrane protein EcfT [Cellulomonas shaoxiangyii]
MSRAGRTGPGRPQRPPWAGPLGLHHPGHSPLHRAPVAAKLLGLAALGLAVVLVRGVAAAAVGLGVVVGATWLARVPWHRTTRGLLPVAATALVLGAYQTWVGDPARGAEAALDLLTLVLAGSLVTATTRADDLLGAVTRAARPLRHVGLPPETVGLAVGLFLRTVPVLVHTVTETRDAARARGLARDPRALVVPAAVRMVGRARTTGDALAARGLGEA